MPLPTDALTRKNIPLARGLLDYFPDALAEVAELSRIGNEQHNPGQPMHWAKEKSTDHADCIVRHLIDRGIRDTDGIRHATKVAWRGLALLQIEIDTERRANVPRLPPDGRQPMKPNPPPLAPVREQMDPVDMTRIPQQEQRKPILNQ
jgi:hypothetical protein